MTDQFVLIEANCVECDKIVECFDDDAEFQCPYCNTVNVFVDEDEEIEEMDDEWEIVEKGSTNLKPNVSILWTWCSRHEQPLDHLWTGLRLRCLTCWPSYKPKGFSLRG